MSSLTQKTSVLGYFNAYHLLRRTTYNITKARINDFALKTPDQALTELFIFDAPSPPSPLNENGETIVPTFAAPTITDTLSTSNAVLYDNYWWMYQALKSPSAQYKIVYWLHLLFVTDNDTSFFTNFDYKELLRSHANGSLKDLATRITLNPRMLIYLNNNLNQKNSPNQNYAREFLELFTILKGPQIATGNYTNYTEADVQQAAKVLTGFTLTSSVQLNKTARLNNVDPVTKIPQGFINVGTHDLTNKTFVSGFNTTINAGTTVDTIQAEFQNFINMIFNQDETAKAYCRRMYRYFVGRNVTADIEDNIIVPLATQLKTNNYQILPVIKTLLSSKHFYDEEDGIVADNTIGALVRNPLELYFHMFSLLNLTMPTYSANPKALHNYLSAFATYSQNTGMPVFRPQTVNGYAAYSSSPHYDKNWITTSSLRIRYNNSIDVLINGSTQNGFLFKLNLPIFVKDSGYFQNPGNADILVSNFCELLLVDIPPTDRLNYFKNVFLGGLSLTNWLNEWNNFVNTNTATNVKIPIDRLVKALIKSPEFQVM